MLNIDRENDCHVLELLGLLWMKKGKWERLRGLWVLKRAVTVVEEISRELHERQTHSKWGKGENLVHRVRKSKSTRRHSRDALEVHKGSLEQNASDNNRF